MIFNDCVLCAARAAGLWSHRPGAPPLGRRPRTHPTVWELGGAGIGVQQWLTLALTSRSTAGKVSTDLLRRRCCALTGRHGIRAHQDVAVAMASGQVSVPAVMTSKRLAGMRNR
jgi:hypothetical protein